MARFDKYAAFLKKLEGGYSNKESDKGGPTMMGITLKTYRAWYGADKTIEDLKRITEAEWTHIMKKGYWDVAGCDYIENQSVAEIIADWVVNSGPGVLRKVQSIVGTEVDGKVGPKTLICINNYKQKCLHCKIWDARKEFYERTALQPGQEKNLAGWINRLNKFVYDGK